MKKYLKNHLFWSKLLLFVLSVVSGGGAMAVEIGGNGSDTDPNAGGPLEGATEDSPGKGIDQQGQGGTGSAMTDAGLTDNQVEDYVSKFKAYKFPMHTDFLRKAKQIKVDTKEPEHYTIGEAVMDCETKTALDNSVNKDNEVTLPLFKNDMKLFAESSTVLVDGVTGFDKDGSSDGSPLVLYVTAVEKGTGVTVCALNGPMHNGEMYVPNIPANSTLHVMAPAMSESEVEIAPDAAYPKPERFFLQKKVCAITWTELFARIKRKANWNVQDLKDWQLAMFRKKCTRSMLIGVGTKIYKTGSKKTGTEYVYTQKGVLRQIRLGYQIGAQMRYEDLIGITRMLFGKFSTAEEMDAYCGSKFIEKLLNIDMSKHKEVSIRNYTDEDLKVSYTSFESTFGKINFKLEHALDDLGYEECAVLFSMQDAKRFYYQKGKTITVDHEKGEGGEVREAKSQYYIQDDCLALTGYNSMLIGPDVTISGYKMSVLDSVMTSAESFAGIASPGEGQIVYLTTADGEFGIGLYQYVSGEWEPYKGELNA